MFDYVKRMIASIVGRNNHEVNKEPRIIKASEHGIDPKLVSFAAVRTCSILQQRGYKAYVVGGAVRDLLLGVKPKDFDVATDATPEQVKRAQRRAFIIGRRFRLVHVVFGNEIVECSTFRALDASGVRKDASGRVISDNIFGEMWEDAARRDFTINALYYDPSTGDIYDYHGGYEDIRRKTLRMIGYPQARYREDPVRMMRAVRISAKLGFKIEKSADRAIAEMAPLLGNVPAARLFDEMVKLFTCGRAEECLLKLRAAGLHRSLLPMLDVILDEPDGEKFLMLALKRTDERIAVGKKISPAFLFATLLWPQVKKRWDAYQKSSTSNKGSARAMALYSAAEEVIATQSAKLAIQYRFVADMKLIWMLQLRFERRTGKNPYTLVEHPKYRAGYDFMLLRSALGHVPESLVHWWEDFVDADEQKRADMVAQAEVDARRTATQARAGSKSRQKEQRDEERFTEEATRYEPRNKSPRRRRSSAEKAGVEKQTSEAKLAEKTDDAASVVSAKPKRRRRRPKSDKAESKLELS